MEPTHVGLIPDGMRRWADANGATYAESYRSGSEKVIEILLALRHNQVRTVSVYNLSRANLARPPAQLDAVFDATVYFFSELLPAHFDSDEYTVQLHGDRSLLPRRYVDAAEALERATHGDSFHINILAAYDAYDELRAAHQRAQQQGCDIAAAFDIPDVDLVIRTTAEPLLSGFLPLQSQYAELVFLDTPLNELTTDHIDDLISEHRRFPQRRGR
ncbi:undecaprenyl diphosphate synthase family protein [Mycolicibacterium parafortuitum]|uniref:(2Z,6E)-farnesyl diphosphate synthase n=1 Tax=Mycolicibacterium parafortuitum TaxID=39692 RepID=A0A375YHP6_MYCPF|nr:undecaprenyl diphosphate synthase family protein [Mycolicibacterium parafortuitum]ORB30625.1 di-trans,poly-cis-decaprenylcistransferase [Mycolicibacterium parafortuitum]SRX80638.1 undecaprenyl pyrophosphate synthetase [Thermoproteus tenax Kra 1] [Mycolicibacterium parafortuitum]